MDSTSASWVRGDRMSRARRNVLVAVAVLGVTAGAMVGVRRVLGPTVEVAPVTRAAFRERLVATGSVRTPSRADLGVLVSGIAAEVPHREGEHVTKGELLLRLSDAQLVAQLAEAEAQVNEARARVTLLSRVGARVASAALRRADADLTRAEQEHARAKQLVASGSAPQAELDDAVRALEAARTSRDAAEVQSASTTGAGADALVARAAVQRAEAQVAVARARLEDARILAPADGVLVSCDVDVGDVVQPGKTLFVLVSDAAREIALFPDERHLRSLRLGQRAVISADAFADERFEGVVSYIAPQIDPDRGTVEVRLSVPSAPPYLKPEMTVSVDIALGERANALSVPFPAVRDANGDKPRVLVVAGDRIATRTVALGLRSDERVEILRGLAAGDQVVVSAAALDEGQRVRARSIAP